MTEDSDMHLITRWFRYVSEECGWRECRYTEESFVDQLATTVGEAR